MTVFTSAGHARPPWVQWLNARPLAILFLVAAAGCYGAMAVGVLPALINVWIADLHISESAAGLIASGNVLGATLALALGVWLVTRVRLVTIMVIGLVLAAPCDAFSIFARDVPLLAALRLACGFGLGLIVAAATNWIGRNPQADRGFAFYMTLQFLFTAALFAIVPLLEPRLGHAAVYVALLMLACCTLILLPGLAFADGGEILPAQQPNPGAVSRTSAPAFLIIASIVLFELAAIGMWTYLLRYGEATGLSSAAASQALSLSSLCGIPGGILVAYLGARGGRLVPIIAALGMFIAILLAFSVRLVSPLVFIVGTALQNVAWNFVFPYLQGVQSVLDRSGRLAVWGMLCASLGGALGPALLGATVNAESYRSAFLLAAAILAGSLVLAVWPARLTDRQKDG